MTQSFDLETMLSNLPAKIEELENVFNSTFPATCDTIDEGTKFLGGKLLIDLGDDTCDTLRQLADLMKKLCGEEGDSVKCGTAYGLLNSARVLDATMNGGV